MSTRAEVLLWAQRVMARSGAPAHQILEVPATATVDEAQAAFHKIARIAHPDLHRTALTPDELELVTSAYARAAGAYQDLRGQRTQTARMRPIRDPASGPNPGGPAAAPPAPAAHVPGASAMSSKALIYYRKAELSLKRGDLRGAVLQLKMAIAADPQSSFLRTALGEVEAEISKNP
jgi:hypothetical protein